VELKKKNKLKVRTNIGKAYTAAEKERITGGQGILFLDELTFC
jgi:hypothetical protein